MKKEQILGLVRHILTFGGGYVIAKGLISESNLNEILGSVMGLIGSIWSVQQKKA